MKKNIISIAVIVVLFGALTAVAFSSKSGDAANVDASGKSAGAAVKICPNTGLACTEDGDCDEEEEAR